MKRLGKDRLSAKVWAAPVWGPRFVQIRIGSIDFSMDGHEATELARKLLAAADTVRHDADEVPK